MKYRYSRKQILQVLRNKLVLPEFKTTSGVRMEDLKAMFFTLADKPKKDCIECVGCGFDDSMENCIHCNGTGKEPKTSWYVPCPTDPTCQIHINSLGVQRHMKSEHDTTKPKPEKVSVPSKIEPMFVSEGITTMDTRDSKINELIDCVDYLLKTL